jgi:hypothetical protein
MDYCGEWETGTQLKSGEIDGYSLLYHMQSSPVRILDRDTKVKELIDEMKTGGKFL